MKIYHESISSPVRVDKEKGVIYDALLLGTNSMHGRTYPNDVREKYISKFEGVKVNLSHPEDRSAHKVRVARDFKDRVGKVFDVRNTPEGVRGNLKILKSHPWANVVFESAEDAPDCFCCSPVIIGDDKSNTDGTKSITVIDQVMSIDLVTEGGTTKSFFEDADGEEMEEEEGPKAEEHYRAACLMYAVELVEKALDGGMSPEEVGKDLKDHLKKHLKLYKEKEDEEAEEKEEKSPEEKQMEEDYKYLKLKDSCRVFMEDQAVEYDEKLLKLLMDLPNDEKRKEHIALFKKTDIIKKSLGTKNTYNKQELSWRGN